MNTILQSVVNTLPITLFFTSMPDRQQALKYINYLYENVPESKTMTPDKLYREVIAKHLRIVNMKIIEPEILILIALRTITLQDFTMPSDDLIKKIISENPDQYELDILYRVLSQIMTKIPRDLKERLTGKQKLQIFHLVSKFIKIDANILENFIEYDPLLNTPITMDINADDYKVLNEKYLKELYKFQKKHMYLNANSLEYGALAADLYQQDEIGNTTNNLNAGNADNTLIRAQYIDKNPDLMLGTTDNIVYYFDSSSGTISELPMNNKQVPVSINDLKTILINSKINKSDIDNTLTLLTATTTIPNNKTLDSTEPEEQGILHKIKSYFSFTPNISNVSSIINTPTAQIVNNTKHNSKNTDNTNNIDNTDSSPVPPEFLKQLKQYNYEYKSTDTHNTNNTIDNTNKQTHNANNLDIKYNLLNQTYIKNSKDNKDIQTNPNSISHFKNITDKTDNSDNTNNTNKTNKTDNTDNKNKTDNKNTTDKTDNKNTTDKTDNTDNTYKKNNTDTATNITQMNVINKIKNNNKKIETIALGFITTIILIFLLVIFNTLIKIKN